MKTRGGFFSLNRKSFARFYCYKGIFASDYMVFEGKGGSSPLFLAFHRVSKVLPLPRPDPGNYFNSRISMVQ